MPIDAHKLRNPKITPNHLISGHYDIIGTARMCDFSEGFEGFVATEDMDALDADAGAKFLELSPPIREN